MKKMFYFIDLIVEQKYVANKVNTYLYTREFIIGQFILPQFWIAKIVSCKAGQGRGCTKNNQQPEDTTIRGNINIFISLDTKINEC